VFIVFGQWIEYFVLIKKWSMNVLIIGNGVYVSGRGTDGFGTVLPAVLEHQRVFGNLDTVTLVGTQSEHAEEAKSKVQRLMELTNVSVNVDSLPLENCNVRYPAKAYKEVLDRVSGPTCAIVVVPDHMHYEITRECLIKRLPTLVVKPLTTTVAEAKDLIYLCEKHEVYGVVEFHKRFDRHNLKLREGIHSDKFGEILYFLVEYSQKKHVPAEHFSSWISKTNIFQYLGVHYVDVIYFVTRAKPIRVLVLGQRRWLSLKNIDALDTIHVTIEWQAINGGTFFSFFHTGWIDPETETAESNQRIQLIGTKGRIKSDQKYRGLQMVSDADGVEDLNPDFCAAYFNDNGSIKYSGYGIESICTYLSDADNLLSKKIDIASLSKNRPTFSDSLCSTAVVESVNKGLREQGTWTDVYY
jgi:predicted dehydrogenase